MSCCCVPVCLHAAENLWWGFGQVYLHPFLHYSSLGMVGSLSKRVSHESIGSRQCPRDDKLFGEEQYHISFVEMHSSHVIFLDKHTMHHSAMVNGTYGIHRCCPKEGVLWYIRLRFWSQPVSRV